jgi:hypothetical protein
MAVLKRGPYAKKSNDAPKRLDVHNIGSLIVCIVYKVHV